jgi:hypothetical protein|tara:strand:- start:157 stop:774 length:618 start_codon:yes stop_codon:yes gene_type:complete
MKSINHFLIEPIGSRYDNEVEVGDKKLIVNSEIQNHEYVNRCARVLVCPALNTTSIREGDEIIVHHNVFRRWYDVKGKEKNSKAYFKDNTYLVSLDQIFLIKKNTRHTRRKDPFWMCVDGFSFVQPIKYNTNIELNEKEDPYKGVIIYSDGSTNVGDLVGYTPFSKYEFVINGKRLYRVYNKFITIKYEYQGNEEAYNPSWAQSS